MATPRDINFIKSKDVAEESLFLDLKQFEERTIIEGLINTVSALKQVVYDQAVILAESFLLDQASGAQLDAVGEELGIPRLGQDDITYRIFLQLAAYKSKSIGTRPEIIDIVSKIVGGPLDEILTYSGVSKSVDISLFLACFDNKTTTEELLEAFPLVTSHRVVDRFGTGWIFNSEQSPTEQRVGSGFISVFDEIPNIDNIGGSRLGTLVSSSDSYQTEFQYTGLADRYRSTYMGFGTTKILTRNFTNGLIQLRRSSDNNITTIRSINNELNEQDIVDFNDGSDMFVVRWYDQLSNLDFYQPVQLQQPSFNPNDKSITFDLVDDSLTVSGVNSYTNGAIIVNTLYGNVLSIQDIGSTLSCPSFSKLKGVVVVERPLKLGEYNSYVRLANTPKKVFIGTTTKQSIYHNINTTRTLGNYQINFYGGNESTYSTTNNNTTTDLALNGLTSPYTMTLTYDMFRDSSLSVFNISGNNLYGYFPAIQEMTGVTVIDISLNNIEGSIADISRLTTLSYLDVSGNNLSGYLSHDEVGVIAVSPVLGELYAQDNNLSQVAVDRLLLDLVTAGRTSVEGTCVVNLGGTGNSTPSISGAISASTLISRGWTVTTN